MRLTLVTLRYMYMYILYMHTCMYIHVHVHVYVYKVLISFKGPWTPGSNYSRVPKHTEEFIINTCINSSQSDSSVFIVYFSLCVCFQGIYIGCVQNGVRCNGGERNCTNTCTYLLR